jgi:hypothetical protein
MTALAMDHGGAKGGDLMRRPTLVALAVCAALAAPSAQAHHSGAMFDRTRTVTVSGTVRELQWTSPHCWLQVIAAGQPAVEWSIEMGAPFELYRGGWRPTILKPGDKVTVVFNPVKDGSNGGLYVSAVDADGQPIGKAH